MGKQKVAYLCDRTACGSPRPDGCGTICKYTTKVTYAINFDLMDDGSGYWAESEKPESYSEFVRSGGYGEYER